MSRQEVMDEIHLAVIFYVSNGWDFIDVVAFILWRYDHALQENQG